MSKFFDRLTENIAFIQQLGDNPNADNNLNAQNLKAWFDKAPLAIQTFVNDKLIPQIELKFSSVDQWIEVADQNIKNFVVGAGFVPIDGSVPLTGNLDIGNNKIKNLSDPVEDFDAVNKKYADAIKESADNAQNTADGAVDLANSKCSRKSMTIKLLASGWSGKYQVVTASGVQADESLCDVLTSPVEASREEYNDCVVRCTGQGDGSLTFMCDDVPVNDLTVGVIVLI